MPYPKPNNRQIKVKYCSYPLVVKSYQPHELYISYGLRFVCESTVRFILLCCKSLNTLFCIIL